MADYYVAKDGDDNGAGTIGDPFLTVMHGIDALSSGDTLYIRAGTYTEGIHGIPSGGGSWESATTVQAYNNEVVTINGAWSEYVYYTSSDDWIVIADIIFDGVAGTKSALSIGNTATYQRIQDCEIKNSAWNAIIIKGDHNEFLRCDIHDSGQDADRGHGIYIKGNYTLIEDCQVYNHNGHGIHVFDNDDLECHDNVIRGNLVHDNDLDLSGYYGDDAPGIGVYLDDNNQVYNNIVYSENSRGIQVGGGAGATLVYNNTIYDCRDYGIVINSSGGDYGPATNTVARNNIAYGCGTNIYDVGTDTVQDHNITTNPDFVNAGAHNFHLQSTSDARDAGATIALVTDDYDDVARPQGEGYCIGAFEYAGGDMSIVVDIDHEGGDLSEYDSTVIDGGDLSVGGGAALAGTNYGLSCLIDDATAIYGQIALPAPESSKVRLRFYIDPNSLTMADGDQFDIVSSDNALFFVRLYNDGGSYKIIFKIKDDASAYKTITSGAISDAEHYVEAYEYGAAGTGTSELWVDGVSQGTQSDLDNDTRVTQFTYLRMGAVTGIDAGTHGTLYLDELVINDDGNEIGPLVSTPKNTGKDAMRRQRWQLWTGGG